MREDHEGVGRVRLATAALALASGSALLLAPAVESGNGPAQRTCFGKAPTLVAVPGETTWGTRRDDVIVGSRRGERIEGNSGDDLICGGNGEDVVDADSGNDRLNGQGDDDLVRGGPGDDKMIAGPGDDIIEGTTGSGGDRDIAKGSDGDDEIDVKDQVGNDVADGGLGTNRCESDTGDVVSRCTPAA